MNILLIETATEVCSSRFTSCPWNSTLNSRLGSRRRNTTVSGE